MATLEIDPIKKQLITEGGLENLLNPQTQVSATQVSEPAKEIGIMTDDQARTATTQNINWIDTLAKMKEQALGIQTALKSGQIEGITPPATTKFEDIDIYKGNESYRISTKDIDSYLKKGWSTTPTDEFLETEAEYEAKYGKSDGTQPTPKVKTSEELALEQEQAKADAIAADLKKVNDALEVQKADADAITQGIIGDLQKSYEASAEAQKEINRRAEQIVNTINIRFGTSRYLPGLAMDLVSSQERAGLRELAIMRAKRDELINAAKQARNDKDWEALNARRKEIEATKKEQDAILLDLKKSQLEKSDELELKKTRITNQSKVADLISQGFDKNDVIKKLAGIVDLKEVDEVFDMLLEDSAGLNEEVIDRFTDENGERINVLYNKNTGEIKQLKFGKVQTTGGAEVSQKDIDSWVDLLAKGQTQIYNIPMNIRNEVVSRASEKGVQIISPTFAKASADAISSFNSAMSQLSLISNQSLKVITATNIAEIPAQAAKGLPGVRIAFPEYKIYKDSIDAFLSMLTRAAGERGVLTNTDVGRIKKALPDLNTDTIYTATEKLKNFKGLLESIKTGAVDAYTAQQFGITPKESTTQNDYSGQLKSGEILVKEKSTGQVGAILESEFDDKLYEKITQ